VVVGEGDNGQATDGAVVTLAAPRRGGRVGVDEVRGGVAQAFGGGDRRHVARVPAIAGRIVVLQERALRLTDTEQAGDRRLARRTRGAGGLATAPGGRNEAAVDDHRVPSGQAQRRH